MTVEQRRERATGGAEALGGGRYRQLQGVKAQLLDDFPDAADCACAALYFRLLRSSLVVIDQIDIREVPKSRKLSP